MAVFSFVWGTFSFSVKVDKRMKMSYFPVPFGTLSTLPHLAVLGADWDNSPIRPVKSNLGATRAYVG